MYLTYIGISQGCTEDRCIVVAPRIIAHSSILSIVAHLHSSLKIRAAIYKPDVAIGTLGIASHPGFVAVTAAIVAVDGRVGAVRDGCLASRALEVGALERNISGTKRGIGKGDNIYIFPQGKQLSSKMATIVVSAFR